MVSAGQTSGQRLLHSHEFFRMSVEKRCGGIVRGWGARPGGWTRPSAGSSMWSVTLPVTEQKMSQRMLEAEAIWMDSRRRNLMLSPTRPKGSFLGRSYRAYASCSVPGTYHARSQRETCGHASRQRMSLKKFFASPGLWPTVECVKSDHESSPGM